MQFSDYLKMALTQIRKNAVRSMLTILGIVIGVTAMIAVFSVGNAGKDRVYEELRKFGIDRLLLYPNEVEDAFALEDIGLLEDRLHDTETISPQTFWKGNIYYEGKSGTVDLVATTPVLKDVEQKVIGEGRFINDTDVSYERPVIVLADDLKETLFGNADAIGKTVEMQGKKFTVVGVEENTKPLYSAIVAEKSYIPITTALQIFPSAHVEEISITVDDSKKVDKVAEKAVGLLSQKYGDKSVKIMNLSEEIQNADTIMSIFTLVVGAIAIISLLVGGIGIMNIMLVTVRERTKEIGVRKALGAKNSHILKQFLMEAMSYGLLGSLLGVLLGVGVTFLAGALIDLNTKISIWAIVLSVCFATGTGIVFGIMPALKASKLDPVQALRQEV